jgi:hypothetical protein
MNTRNWNWKSCWMLNPRGFKSRILRRYQHKRRSNDRFCNANLAVGSQLTLRARGCHPQACRPPVVVRIDEIDREGKPVNPRSGTGLSDETRSAAPFGYTSERCPRRLARCGTT